MEERGKSNDGAAYNNFSKSNNPSRKRFVCARSCSWTFCIYLRTPRIALNTESNGIESFLLRWHRFRNSNCTKCNAHSAVSIQWPIINDNHFSLCDSLFSKLYFFHFVRHLFIYYSLATCLRAAAARNDGVRL